MLGFALIRTEYFLEQIQVLLLNVFGVRISVKSFQYRVYSLLLQQPEMKWRNWWWER